MANCVGKYKKGSGVVISFKDRQSIEVLAFLNYNNNSTNIVSRRSI